MKYLIKDTENNRLYRPELVGMTLEGESSGEYTKVVYNNELYNFLTNELKQIKEVKITTNKTKVLNTLRYINKEDKQDENVKDVLRIKKSLTQCTNEYIESITHYYNQLVNIYCLSCKCQISYIAKNILKDAIKEILKSNVVIEPYNMEYLNDLKRYNLI